MDNGSEDFSQGMTDGYCGFTMRVDGSGDYVDGYNAGVAQWEDESDRDHMADYYSDAELGMYDDDPSPYAGDYSEM